MQLLITGGSGDLGRVLTRLACANGHTVTATYLNHPERIPAEARPIRLDLTNREEVKRAIDQARPDAVIHAALSLGASVQEILSAAYHVATLTPKKSRVIYLSTDMVFDGRSAPYLDDSPPAPVSPYGQAKAEMEMMAETVVRTSLIYDFDPTNKQIAWMLDRINSGEKVKLFHDEIRCPIWAVNLAEVLLELISSPYKGILNVASPEPLSRLALGSRLLTALSYNAVEWVEAASVHGTGRQPDLTLDVRRARLMLKTPLLSFTDAHQKWYDGRTSTKPNIQTRTQM